MNPEAVKSNPWTRPALLLLLVLPPLLVVGNPAISLLVGAVIAVALNRPLLTNGPKLSKLALQTAIVLLGFRLNVETIFTLTSEYAWLTTSYVLCTLALGLGLGMLLRVEPVPSQLMAAGTAICGGTAIASLSPVLGAKPSDTAVTLAMVFLLNAVALFVFPVIGHWLNLTQLEFGLWSALAIHDTSSVVATAAIYGEEAQEIATTIKLGRTLWLIPAVFVAGLLSHSGGARLRVPGFILLFIAAAGVGSIVAVPAVIVSGSSLLSKMLLVIALFLVGTELTRSILRGIRGRVAWQAICLWSLVAPLSLVAVLFMTR